MGREARAEFNEPAAPEKADRDTLGASLMGESALANTDVPFSAPWAEAHAQGVAAVNGEWNWEYGLHKDMTTQAEEVRDRLLLAIYGAFSLAKKDPVHARRMLVLCPFILGKRESRRLMGDYVYSERDVTERRIFPDAIAAGSWSVDLHYDDFKEGVDFLTTCRQPHYGRYYIPYRAIYSRNVPNLFMAGRCFSCTHVGLGGPRVINTLAQLGVAAGEAAALCRKYACTPRDIWERATRANCSVAWAAIGRAIPIRRMRIGVMSTTRMRAWSSQANGMRGIGPMANSAAMSRMSPARTLGLWTIRCLSRRPGRMRFTPKCPITGTRRWTRRACARSTGTAKRRNSPGIRPLRAARGGAWGHLRWRRAPCCVLSPAGRAVR